MLCCFFVCLFFIIIFIIYFILFYLCVLFTFIVVCVCVCGFFVSMGRTFNGRRVCGSLQLYQRQEFNKNKLLLVLFAIQVQNTGHIFLLLVCIVALGHKKTCFSSPPVPKNRAAPVFHFIFILKLSYKKTAPKHFRARAVTMRVSSRCTICLTPNSRFSF